MASLLESHNARWTRLDRQLPQVARLPEPGPEDVVLEVPGGVGLARLIRTDASSLEATWHPSERHVLVARIGDDDPVASMDALLSRWRDVVLASAGGATSSAEVTWPCRDVAMTRLFLDRGLAPRIVSAIRPAGRRTPEGSEHVVVRRTTEADLDAVVDLELQLVRWNELFGQMAEQPNSAELIRAKHSADERPWSWLAEVDGAPVGLVSVLDPYRTSWTSGLSSFDRVAYLSDMMVVPDRRGLGVGAALVGRVHDELDDEGLQAIVLHYLGLNSLAGPFWHRCGYRPLTISWEVRPATHLR